MNAAEYERLVSDLVTALVETVDGLAPEHVAFGRRNRLKGASGHSHQIDVSFRAGSGLHLIECKCWSKRIKVDAVLTLFARIYDVQAANPSVTVRGALATTKGLQRGADKIASHFGIVLQLIQSTNEFAVRYKDHVHLGLAEAVVMPLADMAAVRIEPVSPIQ
jgi:hypothetical protein